MCSKIMPYFCLSWRYFDHIGVRHQCILNLINHCEAYNLLLCQFTLWLHKLIDVFSVPTNILELLADRLAYLFAGTFFTIGQVQVILSGISAVHPWNFFICLVPWKPYKVLKILILHPVLGLRNQAVSGLEESQVPYVAVLLAFIILLLTRKLSIIKGFMRIFRYLGI